MSNRPKLRQRAPDRATQDRIKDDLRCWSCAAEPRLAFTSRRGLSATVDHLDGCRSVPAEQRAAGNLRHVTEPVLYEVPRG